MIISTIMYISVDKVRSQSCSLMYQFMASASGEVHMDL